LYIAINIVLLLTFLEELLNTHGFDTIMLCLKQKTSTLDISIIAETEKFENIYKLLPEIDKKYDLEKEKDFVQ
jgi:hypothetical protein